MNYELPFVTFSIYNNFYFHSLHKWKSIIWIVLVKSHSTDTYHNFFRFGLVCYLNFFTVALSLVQCKIIIFLLLLSLIISFNALNTKLRKLLKDNFWFFFLVLELIHKTEWYILRKYWSVQLNQSIQNFAYSLLLPFIKLL